MKNISTNELQNQLSKIIKQVEGGEVYQVARYSKPVAYLVSREKYEDLISGNSCKECVSDLRKIATTIKSEARSTKSETNLNYQKNNV